MRHHRQKVDFPFFKVPVDFDKDTDKCLLQFCLGGTLYMPGTRKIANKILDKELQELTSMVMCLEDSIPEGDLPQAEINVLEHLDVIAGALKEGRISIADIPLIFVRVRTSKQFSAFCERLEPDQAKVLSGFVFPKFYSNNALLYLNQLRSVNQKFGLRLYGMPIFEGRKIAFRESRLDELRQLSTILWPYRDLILNIRIGATDFSSAFGVRRGINSSIYDIITVRDCLSDILNYFNRDDQGYTVSAPVWEYFLATKAVNIRKLSGREINRSLMNRESIVNNAVDGLLREVLLDKTNGFVGKTIIHPSHLRYVNAMQAVTREEFEDARQILDMNGGVKKSSNANKMNESNPHRNWAKRLVKRAEAFGVIEDESAYLKLILD